MYALIYDNKIVDISIEKFATVANMEWVVCPDQAEVGDSYVSGQIPDTKPARTVAQARSEKLAELSAFRYAKEVGGFDYQGVLVDTSRVSQQMMIAARTMAKEKKANNEWYTFSWKAKNGWYQLTCDNIISMADAVALYVQHCFSEENRIGVIISGLTSVVEIDAMDYMSQWRDIR